jgi:hypothetical protein
MVLKVAPVNGPVRKLQNSFTVPTVVLPVAVVLFAGLAIAIDAAAVKLAVLEFALIDIAIRKNTFPGACDLPFDKITGIKGIRADLQNAFPILDTAFPIARVFEIRIGIFVNCLAVFLRRKNKFAARTMNRDGWFSRSRRRWRERWKWGFRKLRATHATASGHSLFDHRREDV